MPKRIFVLAGLCTLVTVLSGCAAPNVNEPQEWTYLPATLPEGRWTGNVATRNIPDMDNDGEWQQAISIENCDGSTRLRFKGEEGYSAPTILQTYSFASTYLLFYQATEFADGSGWSETQAWTLVDARPKGWSIAQSRSVINQQMDPDEPWFTFRRLGFGWLEYDPDCDRKRSHAQQWKVFDPVVSQ